MSGATSLLGAMGIADHTISKEEIDKFIQGLMDSHSGDEGATSMPDFVDRLVQGLVDLQANPPPPDTVQQPATRQAFPAKPIPGADQTFGPISTYQSDSTNQADQDIYDITRRLLQMDRPGYGLVTPTYYRGGQYRT